MAEAQGKPQTETKTVKTVETRSVLLWQDPMHTDVDSLLAFLLPALFNLVGVMAVLWSQPHTHQRNIKCAVGYELNLFVVGVAVYYTNESTLFGWIAICGGLAFVILLLIECCRGRAAAQPPGALKSDRAGVVEVSEA